MRILHRLSPCVGALLLAAATAIPGGTDDGLAAHFLFDGNAADASGNGRDGIEYGGVYYSPGKIGQALALNGTDAHVLAPAVNATGSLTVTAWVMPERIDPTYAHTIVMERAQYEDDYCGPDSAGTYELQIYEGRFAFAVSSTTDGECTHRPRIFDELPADPGQFYCVAGVFDRATRSAKLYVNGTRVAEAGTGDALRTREDAVLRVGMNHPWAQQLWDGLIDDLRIYERMLTDGEIQALCGLTVPVSIDIKPGSYPNSINLGSAGTIPVAILSTVEFDASAMTNPESLRLAGAAVNLIGRAARHQCGSQDVNNDGNVDLVCHFTTAQLVIEPGDSVAVLEGKTFAGRPIRGEDMVRIVPD